MMVSCGLRVVKFALFAFNLVFAVSGAALVVIGGIALADVVDYTRFLEDAVVAPPIALIVLGAVIFVIAFLGCCGAIRESHGLLMAFAVLLLLVFIAEIGVGVAAVVSRQQVGEKLGDTMRRGMVHYNKSPLDRKAWDAVQTRLMCCGVDGAGDWAAVTPPDTVPRGCCVDPYANGDTICARSPDPRRVHQRGCAEQLERRVRESAGTLAAVGLGLAALQIAGIVCACCLASAIKRDKEEEEEGKEEAEDEEAPAEEE